jgi:hypothetical protein
MTTAHIATEAKARRCKECKPEDIRHAPHPGPRCGEHHSGKLKKDKAVAFWANILRRYNLTEEEWRALYAAQGGRCAICQKVKHPGKLGVDHNHLTGEVRGLLCVTGDKSCNRILGWLDAAALARALGYANNPPARQVLGNTIGKVPSDKRRG